MASRRYRHSERWPESWQEDAPHRTSQRVPRQAHRQPPGGLEERQAEDDQAPGHPQWYEQRQGAYTRSPGDRHRSTGETDDIASSIQQTHSQYQDHELPSKQPGQLV